ncbi:MAG: hypothetical protein ACRCX8_00715 [Sarcina sp.]
MDKLYFTRMFATTKLVYGLPEDVDENTAIEIFLKLVGPINGSDFTKELFKYYLAKLKFKRELRYAIRVNRRVREEMLYRAHNRMTARPVHEFIALGMERKKSLDRMIEVESGLRSGHYGVYKMLLFKGILPDHSSLVPYFNLIKEQLIHMAKYNSTCRILGAYDTMSIRKVGSL